MEPSEESEQLAITFVSQSLLRKAADFLVQKPNYLNTCIVFWILFLIPILLMYCFNKRYEKYRRPPRNLCSLLCFLYNKYIKGGRYPWSVQVLMRIIGIACFIATLLALIALVYSIYLLVDWHNKVQAMMINFNRTYEGRVNAQIRLNESFDRHVRHYDNPITRNLTGITLTQGHLYHPRTYPWPHKWTTTTTTKTYSEITWRYGQVEYEEKYNSPFSYRYISYYFTNQTAINSESYDPRYKEYISSNFQAAVHTDSTYQLYLKEPDKGDIFYHVEEDFKKGDLQMRVPMLPGFYVSMFVGSVFITTFTLFLCIAILYWLFKDDKRVMNGTYRLGILVVTVLWIWLMLFTPIVLLLIIICSTPQNASVPLTDLQLFPPNITHIQVMSYFGACIGSSPYGYYYSSLSKLVAILFKNSSDILNFYDTLATITQTNPNGMSSSIFTTISRFKYMLGHYSHIHHYKGWTEGPAFYRSHLLHVLDRIFNETIKEEHLNRTRDYYIITQFFSCEGSMLLYKQLQAICEYIVMAWLCMILTALLLTVYVLYMMAFKHIISPRSTKGILCVCQMHEPEAFQRSFSMPCLSFKSKDYARDGEEWTKIEKYEEFMQGSSKLWSSRLSSSSDGYAESSSSEARVSCSWWTEDEGKKQSKPSKPSKPRVHYSKPRRRVRSRSVADRHVDLKTALHEDC